MKKKIYIALTTVLKPEEEKIEGKLGVVATLSRCDQNMGVPGAHW